MRNILYGLIILGILASVAGILVSFTERNKAIGERIEADNQRDLAIKTKRVAEEERKKALEEKLVSDNQTKEYKDKMGQALSETSVAQAKVSQADAERDKAIKDKEEAERARENALMEKAQAQRAKKESQDKQEDAEARLNAEVDARRIAENNLEKESEAKKRLEKDLYDIREVVESSRKIAIFCSDILAKVFIPLDSGDKHYLRACELWRDAQNPAQKRNLLTQFQKSKENYESARASLAKLEYLTKETEQIRSLLNRAIQNSIESMETMINLLRKMLSETASVSPEEKNKQGQIAIDKKLSADKNVIEVCSLILGLMDIHKEAFTPSQRVRVEGIKKDIQKRLIPEDSESFLK
ncbi:MAG: hypothetical protein QME51_07375 [Planctomycetota bacterium]|nr:hypothetical protein [Planctomycetota bacterium]MDI6788175.1 hypothetical protein [Planctomycetota bacterium]